MSNIGTKRIQGELVIESYSNVNLGIRPQTWICCSAEGPEKVWNGPRIELGPLGQSLTALTSAPVNPERK